MELHYSCIIRISSSEIKVFQATDEIGILI